MPNRDRRGLPVQVRLELVERELLELRADLERMEQTVETMSTEERIRAGVRKELQARQPFVATATAAKVRETGGPIVLTTYQKIGAGVAALIFTADAIRGFLT